MMGHDHTSAQSAGAPIGTTAHQHSAAAAAIAAAAANGSTPAVSPVFTAFVPEVLEADVPPADDVLFLSAAPLVLS